MKTTHRFLLAALVSSSLGALAMPALADPGEGGGQRMAHFDGDRGDRGHSMRGGPHGPGPGGERHGGPMGGPLGGPLFGGPMGGPGGPGAEMIIERFDVNEDGQITRDEVTTVTAEKIKTFDADADGTLSLDEYQALWTDTMNERIVRSFQFHDPDGDAEITLKEYSEPADKLFARFDRNGDGTISPDEFGPPRGGDRPDGPPGMGPGNGPGGPDGADDDMDDNG